MSHDTASKALYGRPLDSLATYWLLVLANDAFRTAAAGCDYFLSQPRLPDPIANVILAGIHVSYARPFTSNDEIGHLPTGFVPREAREFHDSLVWTRNKIFAHSAGDVHKSQHPIHAISNSICIEVSASALASYPEYALPNESTVRDIKSHSIRLAEKADYWASRCEKLSMGAVVAKGRGRYRLRLIDGKPQIEVLDGPSCKSKHDT